MTNKGHEGHRKRLLARFEKSGLSSLADYEIVELLLSYVIHRKDTKPLAKELLARFKTVSGVLHADRSKLAAVKGIGRRTAMLFALMREAIVYCMKEKYEKRPLVLHRRDVEDYLKFAFGRQGDEYVAALFLDSGHNVIATEIVSEGTVNQCAVYPRQIVEKAVQCKAASIILAHNHPGGASGPSEADWNITEKLFKIGKLMEIPLLDHVIVTREAAVSLCEMPRWPK